ncbi:hypothetical protein COCON_G00056260 [Conger conger]|uniref:T-box domain-containing protein n=1 Tax=Conger conger TaxID=82655 RepID=A0A9Q1I4B0_CONCO|nr:hypothetical protein COCON_G00056260 [Conger conger]
MSDGRRSAAALSSRAHAFSVEALIGTKKRRKTRCEPSMESLATNGHLKTEDMAHGLDIDPDSARFSMEDVRVELQCADLWRRFHDIGTEMIVTKAGRRMFPVVRVKVTGLDPHQQYFIAMDIIPVDNKRYRPPPPRVSLHPDAPAPGHTWSTQVISFHKLKLTNNLLDQQGHEEHGQPALPHRTGSNRTRCQVFQLPQTVFTTVTAYQNQQITRLKIDRNPFAKGFRDSGRNRTGLEAVMESYAFCRSPVRTLRFEDFTSMPKQRGGSTGSSPSPSGPAPLLAPGGYGTLCRDRPLCGVGQSEYSPCAWSHDHAPNHTPDHTPDHTLPDYSCLTDRSCARQQTDSYPQQRTCSSLVPMAMQAPCMVGTGAGCSVDARGGRQLGSFPDSQLQCTMQAGEGPNPCGSAPAGHMASAGQCAGFPLHGHYGYAFSSPLSANGVKPASPQAPPLTPCPAAGFAERQDTPTHRTGRSTGSAQQGADSWKADVSLVVGARLQDEGSVRALVLAVQLPARRLFTVITWEDTLEKVMESAKAVLDEGEELPAHLLGKVVKFQLLVAKGNHLQRRTMAGEEKAKGKARAGSSSKEKGGAAAKAAGKAEKGKKASEPPPPAKETTLKRRGEREETSTPIDDEPADGPQLYVLMVGFLQPQLVAVLDLLGVRVSNIIQVSSPHPSIPPGPPQHQPQHEPQHPPQHAPELGTSPTPGHRYADAAQSCAVECRESAEAQCVRLQAQLGRFWRYLDAVLSSGAAGAGLRDVSRLQYSLSEEPPEPPEPQSDPTPAMLAFGMRVFEGVASLIYGCLDWRRQHLHYLGCLRLIQVPAVASGNAPSRQESAGQASVKGDPQTPKASSASKRKSVPDESAAVAPPVVTAECDMQYYRDLLDLFPPETVSVPIILHCLREQVVATQEQIPPPSAVRPQPRPNGLDPSLADHMIAAALSLGLSEEEEQKLLAGFGGQDCVQQQKDLQRPLLVNRHDERSMRLQQLPVR